MAYQESSIQAIFKKDTSQFGGVFEWGGFYGIYYYYYYYFAPEMPSICWDFLPMHKVHSLQRNVYTMTHCA